MPFQLLRSGWSAHQFLMERARILWKRRPPILTGSGAALVVAAVFLNEWLLRAVTHDPIVGHRMVQLHNLQMLAAAAGLILIFRRVVGETINRVRHSAAGRFLFVRPNRQLVVAVIPLVVATAIYWKFACQRDEIPVLLMMTMIAFVWSAASGALLFIFLAVLLSKISRFRLAPLAVAAIWAILVPLETAIYIFGRTRLEAQHFGLATRDSLSGFMSPGIAVLVIVSSSLCLCSGWLAARHAGRISWKACARMGVLLVTAWAINGAAVGYWFSWTFTLKSVDKASLDPHYRRLKYIQPDPIRHLIAEAIPRTSRFHAIDDWHAVREPIEHYQLPLTERPATVLHQSPFRRVILVFTESLSAFFLRASNPRLPATLMPFLDSQANTGRMLKNHRTSAQPTGPGLAVTCCSHPNPSLVEATKFPHSFVRNLREHGWHTVFNTSVTRMFDDQGRKAASAGFEAILDPLNIETGRDGAYIVGWGLCDRISFRRSVEYLAAHRDTPTFMTILTCDTHLPSGRMEYGDLQYPSPPDWIHQFPTLAPLLASFFRFDHDLEHFVSELKTSGLYDDDTLVIITADHCCPSKYGLTDLPGASNSPFERIPLILLTPRALPPFDVNRSTSQLDVGPSLQHLLGLPIPVGCWGRSIFECDRPAATFVGIFQDRVTIEKDGQSEEFELKQPATAMQRGLADLLHRYVR